jgi:hypothetical protein
MSFGSHVFQFQHISVSVSVQHISVFQFNTFLSPSAVIARSAADHEDVAIQTIHYQFWSGKGAQGNGEDAYEAGALLWG